MVTQRARASDPFVLPWPPEPMLAKPADRLPAAKALPGGCLYEPKWDGYRGLIGVGAASARIRSRRGADITAAFPDIAGPAAGQLPPGTLLDGELVVWTGQQLDFSQLQKRLAGPAAALRLARTYPASFVAFDVLAVDGQNLSQRPLRERRRALEQLLPSLSPPLQITPATRDHDTAQQWLADYAAAGAGIEGLVIKGLAQPYRPGRRDWLKLRSRDTVEAVVGAVTGTRSRPERLILGLPGPAGLSDPAVLIVAGTTAPLKPGQQKEIAALLTAPQGEHPWPSPLSAGRTGGWNSEPLHVALVEPSLVVEVEADHAYEYGRWRHLARYIRARPDLSADDITPPGR